jgi:hypothetical protein
MRGRIEGEPGGIDMKQAEIISWAEQKRKNRKNKSAKKPVKAQGSLINTTASSPTVAAKPEKAPMEVMTMVRGKPSLSTDFVYDRTLFDQRKTPREDETTTKWSIKRKQQLQLQKPPPVLMDKFNTVSGGYDKRPSTEKRFAIDPTTNKSLKGVRTEGDHIASLFTVQQMVTPPSDLSADFVKKKHQVREGGTTKLSPKQMQSLYLTDHIQMTSAKVNQAKGAKRISNYKKEGGWGAEGTVNNSIAVKQARGYHDSLLSVAKQFGKRGGFSREDAQAYREIVGEEPNPLLDGSNPEFSPPSTSSNITGFDAYGDKIRQKAADRHYGKEKAKEAKEYKNAKAWAEYSGEKPIATPLTPSLAGKSLKQVKLEKEHGKQNRLRSMGKHQSKPKSHVLNRLAPKATDQRSPKSKPVLQPARQMYHGETTKELKQKAKIKSQKAHLKSIGGKWSNIAGKLPKGAGSKTKKSIITGAVWDPKKYDRYAPQNRVRFNPNIN